MQELFNEPSIARLLDYAKTRSVITYDEVARFLPDYLLETEKILTVYELLSSHNVVIEEKKQKDQNQEKGAVHEDKKTAIDDPVRLYLREIGKETLLTAEKEVELSKQMEEGEEIILNIIHASGRLITELYHLIKTTFFLILLQKKVFLRKSFQSV